MKFKVGDKVRIKSIEEIAAISTRVCDGDYLTEYTYYNTELCREISDDLYFVKEMFRLCGEECVIEECNEDKGYYYLNGELSVVRNYQFLEDWLEKIEEKGYVADFSGKPDTVGEIFNELLPRLEEMFREVYNRGYENGKAESL